MSIHNQEEKVYGKLLTPFGEFELLAPEPSKHDLPFWIRDGALKFYVLFEGFARYIIVKGDFGLVPYPKPELATVKFEVDEESKEGEILYKLKNEVNPKLELSYE